MVSMAADSVVVLLCRLQGPLSSPELGLLSSLGGTSQSLFSVRHISCVSVCDTSRASAA